MAIQELLLKVIKDNASRPVKDHLQIIMNYSLPENDKVKMFLKRWFDLCLTIPGLLFIAPLFVLIAFWIKIDSEGPVFFRQERVGRFNKRFMIYKFRTMVTNTEKLGKHFTVGNDHRITKCGKFLRKYKLDELPQLLNVLKSEMSLVGPRPLVPKHVNEYPIHIRKIVLSVPPGLTGYASIAYINESELLEEVHDPEQFYKEAILPDKIMIYVQYVYNHNIWVDFTIIVKTFLALFSVKPVQNHHIIKNYQIKHQIATSYEEK